MTPAKYVKSCGVKSLLRVSEVTGVSVQTLRNWHYSNEKLFKILIMGVKALEDEK